MDNALRLQGYLDGMRVCQTILKNAVSKKTEEETPLY